MHKLLNTYDKLGYIYEYWLLENGNTKLDFQHRIIWERNFGKIPKGYDIHHINRNKKDNTIESIFYPIFLFGKMVYLSGNLLCVPKRLHTQLFHNVNSKR